jgi:hypothetical protein
LDFGLSKMNSPLIYAAFGTPMAADLRESANRTAAQISGELL